MKIIAFTGPAGSGKDTAGSFFFERGWTVVKFASPMYEALRVMGFGHPLTQQQKEAIIPHLGFSWRKAAQTLGTEWGRNLHPDLWVLIAENRMKEYPYHSYVITDCRFENEADMVRRNGGTVVHILGRKIGTGNDAHASEAGIKFQYDKGDRRVDNSESIEFFHRQLVGIAKELL